MNLRVERIESLKSGLVAAGCFTVAFAIVTIINHGLLAKRFVNLTALQINSDLRLLVSSAIALSTGFLFGVAYRYIIRSDRNPHLQQGAIFAFGLTRGLAQFDVGWQDPTTLWSAAILGVENIWLFAMTALTLDWTIRRKWIKPLE
ncbi:hypothetical protein H6G20_08530 [Desertifilum sp. FACHB-1129]|uniref:Uncharacterized protein n=1 Tax=Desertifilum tharense IPPAS B-1220 TaxID=1781255 RepID=A0A1E5QFT6_9CYAN|nr:MULTISPECIES: hypothetical protein [Cyanophyceae]MCD8486353.1 hypothetical protein [Desertifilum sp.]MDA0212421.1 hypothetical protein [Cyanobacteria bacterium FC1]MDI9641857.1 hypothetical protein [Geitlerinema splendidum]MBD2311702.1 hypothetical protein [Desertifilum sp. FACHB-1129]MBD2322773.1 hypothetical protein [Desertifilum sp. FACHB-866]